MGGSGWQDLSLILYLDSTVQDVIREVSSSDAWPARHVNLLSKTR